MFKASPISGRLFSLFFFHGLCYYALYFTGNILVAGGQSEIKNGQVGQYKTTPKVAAACEVLIRRGATAR